MGVIPLGYPAMRKRAYADRALSLPNPARLLGALPKQSWLKRLRRLGLEVIRAEVGRLDADMRHTVTGHLDDINAMTLLNDERMRTDCRLTLGDDSCDRIGT